MRESVHFARSEPVGKLQDVRITAAEQRTLTDAQTRPVNHNNDTFPANPEGVTFVGRPFPLEDAHEHFSRLRRWGFTFSTYSTRMAREDTILTCNVVRFLVTWEAVEHAGP